MSYCFSLTHDLPAPPQRVYAALTDLDSARLWLPDLIALVPLSPEPIGPGSRWRETRRMLGGKASAVFTLISCHSPDSLSLTARADGDRRGAYCFDYALAEQADGCRLTVTTTIDRPGRLIALCAPLLAMAFKAALRRDLTALAKWLAANPQLGEQAAKPGETAISAAPQSPS